MELKEYICEVVGDIISAVSSLQKEYCPKMQVNGAIINPSRIENGISSTDGLEYSVLRVAFDVSLSAMSSDETKKEGKVGISVISGGLHSEIGSKNEAIQRVKFEIPIILPSVETKGKIMDGAKFSTTHHSK